MTHFEPAVDGYEEQLIRDSTLSVISRLYQKERRKVLKEERARRSQRLARLERHFNY